MDAVVTVIVVLLNALGKLLPEIPGLIDRIRESTELSADGKALLDRIDARIVEHERKLDAMKPLPVPPKES